MLEKQYQEQNTRQLFWQLDQIIPDLSFKVKKEIDQDDSHTLSFLAKR